jgi:plastocyanin
LKNLNKFIILNFSLVFIVLITMIPAYGEESQQTNSSTPVTIAIQPPSMGTPFDPKEIHIMPNSTVTWINNDNVSHTVTSGDPQQGADGKFDSGLIKPGKKFSHIFTEIGTFYYYCQVHPTMTGIVIVNGNTVPEFGPSFGAVFVIVIIGVLIISKKYWTLER